MKTMYHILIALLVMPLLANAGPDVEKYNASDVAQIGPMEILLLRGFDYEEHRVSTRDGYSIHVLRVINPLINTERTNLKRPVIFNHGFLECSSIWLINSRHCRPSFDFDICPGKPLSLESIRKRNDSINGPMLLSNHGYDVWLMSMRGTELSQTHSYLSPLDSRFWEYSLDNFALDDVPSVVDYVQQVTSSPKVAYIGHSQATFSIFALLSKKPEYTDVIEPVIALAPVAYMHQTNSIARPLFLASLKKTQIHGAFPRQARQFRKNLDKVCERKLIANQFFCRLLDAVVGGKGRGPLPGYYSHLPFQSSLNVVRHFGQLVKKEKFTQYDHGEDENLVRYGTKEAPVYNIRDIRSQSICLFSTESDALSHPKDVKLFKQELRVPLLRDVFIKGNFNHFDLITHEDARHLVFGPILKILEAIEHRSGLCARQAFDGTSGNNIHLDSQVLGN